MSSRDRYMAFMWGWIDGAGIRPIRSEFANHATLADVYHEGYDAGRETRSEAREAAENRFGYRETVLRLPEPIGYDTQPMADYLANTGLEWKVGR